MLQEPMRVERRCLICHWMLCRLHSIFLHCLLLSLLTCSSQVYFLKVQFAWESFFKSGIRQTTSVEVGKERKVPKENRRKIYYSTRYIPTQYARIIHQLSCEAGHSNYNEGHEAQRHASYALQVLNLVGEELAYATKLKDDGLVAWSWRLSVLTPILQRQLAAIPDVYLPAVRAGVLPPDPRDLQAPQGEESEESERELTIEDATQFYLGRDPISVHLVPHFRRTFIYSREVRWHLAILLRYTDMKDVDWFEKTLENQDVLLAGESPGPYEGIAPFTDTDVTVLYDESLHIIVEEDLQGKVCAHCLCAVYHLISHYIARRLWDAI